MSTLDEFRSTLKFRISAAGNTSHWKAADADAYMAALRTRRREFDESTRSLIATVIRPRLDAVASFFPSARTQTDDQAHRCWCWFANSDRFPVTAKIEFAL